MHRLAIAALVVLVACQSSRTIATPANPKGENVRCVGINGTPRPDLAYEYSTRNIIIGLVFVEMIAPPVVVVLKELRCPVGAP